MILNNEKKIIMLEKHMHSVIDHLKKLIHWQKTLMLVSAEQDQAEAEKFLNDLWRNAINPQDLDKTKNLRASWINEDAEKINISENEKKKWENEEKKEKEERKKKKKKEEEWINEDEMKNSDDFENHFVKDFYFAQ